LKNQDELFGSLKVRVDFRAGGVEMTLTDVETLAPGAIIPTDLREQDFVDIRVNGQSIGAGEFVKTGDRLAVRVTKLFQND
jgi:flagellar motor switch/type III secretory pathway protein FliN